MSDPADETAAAEGPREFNGYAIAILLGIAGLLEHLVILFAI
ncbi:MAG TPA: hypothetical protein VK015_05325 [Microbacterium sp.]|nr:hypothetical protein [Microbacterium sp.]